MFKALIIFVSILISSVSAYARDRAFGYCERGGQTVTTANIQSSTYVQRSFPSCQVTVYVAGSLTLATIYSDNSSTVLTNPFTAANTGFWFFYADNGNYDIQLSGGGIVTPFVIGDYPLGTSSGPTTANWLTLLNSPLADTRTFDFTVQSPGGSLTASITNTVTLTPVPVGVNGTDVAHWLYLSNGVGTAEPVLITGGTAVSGGTTGTVTFVPTNNHTGPWTISSATNGAQEAMYSSGSPLTVLIAGVVTFHAPLYMPSASGIIDSRYSITGFATDRSIILMASDYPLTATGVITYANGFAGSISKLSIWMPQAPDSANVADYIHWPAGITLGDGTAYGQVTDVDIGNAWVSIDASAGSGTGRGSGFVFSRLHISGYSKGFYFQGPMGDFVRISDIYVGPLNQGTANNTSVFLTNSAAFTTADGFFDIVNFQTFTFQSLVISGGRVNVSNWQPDGTNGIVQSGGRVTITNGYSTLGPVDAYVVDISAGELVLSGMTWEKTVVTSNPFMRVTGAAVVSINDIEAVTGTSDVSLVLVSSNNASLSLKNVFYNNSHTNAVGPFVNVAAAAVSITIQGCTLPATSGGGAKLLAYSGASGNLNITGNTAKGWGIDVTGASNAIFSAVIQSNTGLDSIPSTVVSGSTLTLTAGPKIFLVTGTTGVGTITGTYPGETFQIITTDGAVTFTFSATIGNTITSTQNVPLTGVVVGAQVFLH